MRKIVRFTGVCCANCAAKLERALEKIDGINSVQLNFMAQRVNFDIDDNKMMKIMYALFCMHLNYFRIISKK